MGIDYALAQELRDAGFPLGGDMPTYVSPPDGVTEAADMTRVPSLSNLIEACGKDFLSLIRVDEHQWEAGYGLIVHGVPHYNLQVTASTPDEAVARLFLALKK